VKPKLFSERQLGYFFDGSRRHEALQFLSGLQCEVSVQKHGIRGRLDMLGDVPIEVKTTRASKRGDVPPHYLRQCAYYCVLTGKDTCALVTQYVVEGCFQFQKLIFTREELRSYEEELLANLYLFQGALTRKDCRGLPAGESWQCRSCEYSKDCDDKSVEDGGR
jgi:CRISPR/Cas system-associated exonuclease Cas4 (RecB family)